MTSSIHMQKLSFVKDLRNQFENIVKVSYILKFCMRSLNLNLLEIKHIELVIVELIGSSKLIHIG